MLRRPLLSAALCAVLAAVVYWRSVQRARSPREADLRTLEGFMGLWALPGARYARDFVGLFNPAAVRAARRGSLVVRASRRPARAPAPSAFVAMLGAGVTTQVLKPLLAVQREFPVWHYMGPEAYPSGHTTAVMSFALALVIVSSAALRPLAAAAGGLLTVGTVYSILIARRRTTRATSSAASWWPPAGRAWPSTALRAEARPSLRALARRARAGGRGARGGGRCSR